MAFVTDTDGISLFFVDTNPDGVLQARKGSVAIRRDAGNIHVYQNTDGVTAWCQLLCDTEGSVDLSHISTDAGDGLLTAGFWFSKTFPAGAVNTDTALPSRVGGWRVTDAYLIGTFLAGGAGTAQVQTGAGAPISDAIPLGPAQYDVARAANIHLGNAIVASAGTIRISGVAATTPGEMFVRIEPR